MNTNQNSYSFLCNNCGVKSDTLVSYENLLKLFLGNLKLFTLINTINDSYLIKCNIFDNYCQSYGSITLIIDLNNGQNESTFLFDSIDIFSKNNINQRFQFKGIQGMLTIINFLSPHILKTRDFIIRGLNIIQNNQIITQHYSCPSNYTYFQPNKYKEEENNFSTNSQEYNHEIDQNYNNNNDHTKYNKKFKRREKKNCYLTNINNS